MPNLDDNEESPAPDSVQEELLPLLAEDKGSPPPTEGKSNATSDSATPEAFMTEAPVHGEVAGEGVGAEAPEAEMGNGPESGASVADPVNSFDVAEQKDEPSELPELSVENDSVARFVRGAETGEGSRTMMPLDCLRLDPDHPHLVIENQALRELARDIKQRGQDRPIIVYRVEEHYVVEDGQRIYRGCQIAGREEAWVIIRPARSRLARLRAIAADDELSARRGGYEKARTAAAVRDALAAELGRTPRQEEVAVLLRVEVGTTCERLKVADNIDADVVEQAGLTLEQVAALPHERIHAAAKKLSREARAAWLFRGVNGEFPDGWSEAPRAASALTKKPIRCRKRRDGGIDLQCPSPDKLSPKKAGELCRTLAPFMDELRRQSESG